MLKKILLATIFLSPVTFCMNGNGDEDTAIVRAPSGAQSVSDNSIWGRTWVSVTDVLGRAIGMNRQTARNAQTASERALETTQASLNAATEVRVAVGTISTVTNQLHESGALLSALEQRNQEVGTLRTRLLLSDAAKSEAEARLQRLLSQPTPASATETANAERDSSIRTLGERVQHLSTQVSQIAAERYELETRLLTFKRSLAEIVDPQETDINSLLTKTAEKLEQLSLTNQESARLYSDAIRELQKQIEEK